MDFSGFKQGDRVRIVLETEVRRAGEHLETGRNFFDDEPNDIVSIEKIAPALPTTPGSVIRTQTGTEWILHKTEWLPISSLPYVRAGLDAKARGQFIFPTRWDVVYDAGAK